MSRKPFWLRAVAAGVVLAGCVLAVLPSLAASPAQPTATQGAVMLTAVSRDASVLSGGISTGIRSPRGIANLEQIAWLTPPGVWRDLPCHYTGGTGAALARCRAFAASATVWN